MTHLSLSVLETRKNPADSFTVADEAACRVHRFTVFSTCFYSPKAILTALMAKVILRPIAIPAKTQG